MTKITIYRNENREVERFSCSGHAGYAASGGDIVCASISVLVINTINAIEGLEVEYYDIVDKTTLLPTDTFENAVGCVTVYCGPVRLIDNIQY